MFIDVPAPDHSTLHMLCSSDAEAMLLSPEAAQSLRLRLSSTEDAQILAQLGPAARVGHATLFMRQHWPATPASTSFLVVPGVVAVKGWAASADGVLGRPWFAGHVWSWDYPRKQLVLRAGGWRPARSARELPIAFEDFARVAMSVDGQEMTMRLETGRSAVLTPSALHALHDGRPALRAASTLAHQAFEALRIRHPDWRLIEDATVGSHARMLLVADVALAGIVAGPIWFTEQPDDALTGYQGSIGGNLLSDFVISVDYPRTRAWVQSKSSRQ